MQIYDFTQADNKFYASIGIFWAWGDSKEECIEILAHNIASFES